MEDSRMETHPDLMDPAWSRRAELDARRGAKKDRKQRRKQAPRRRFRPGFRMSRGLVVTLFLSLTAVVLVVAAVVMPQLRGHSSGGSPQPAPVVGGVDLARPYDRTPAANWGEGLAGITVPAGQAVGGFTAQEVDAGYRTVTGAIAAAQLGSRALQDNDGSELLALLTPNERARLAPTLTGPVTAEKGNYLTLIGPKRLLPVSPRMTGFLTAKPGGEGELIIHASYTTAYAFDALPSEARTPADIVPFVREEQDYVIRKAPPFATADAGLSLGDGTAYKTRMACDAIKTGILAPQYADKDRPVVVGAPAVDEVATYDPTKPLPSLNTCG
ncbi:hypothetical protein ACFQ05_24990 [Amycolatopsis umgeniensis]|uniref:Uncharacterized protein n=1 Tax=Amycolatopsis umgeniensis TaxID=336628 RepID=A0A841BCB9_9PSEU|nr:hypothetical protein [Amycolatopsis umgeniensis]MBB5856134.1 hypothetical protein [Amycolatopsis umgeniensis]